MGRPHGVGRRFSAIRETEPKRPLHVLLPDSLLDEMERQCMDQRRSKTSFVRRALEAAMDTGRRVRALREGAG